MCVVFKNGAVNNTRKSVMFTLGTPPNAKYKFLTWRNTQLGGLGPEGFRPGDIGIIFGSIPRILPPAVLATSTCNSTCVLLAGVHHRSADTGRAR